MADKILANETISGNSLNEITSTTIGTKAGLDVSVLGGLLSGVTYDYISMALSSADTVETYTYKSGGSGGTVVAVIVVTYTDDTRETLSSVSRTI